MGPGTETRATTSNIVDRTGEAQKHWHAGLPLKVWGRCSYSRARNFASRHVFVHVRRLPRPAASKCGQREACQSEMLDLVSRSASFVRRFPLIAKSSVYAGNARSGRISALPGGSTGPRAQTDIFAGNATRPPPSLVNASIRKTTSGGVDTRRTPDEFRRRKP